tara:strand:- start:599 stop:916 length:318 start_codon:yes stop_codon:yes gene_type:complete
VSLAFFQEEFFHLRFCVSRFFFRTLNEKKEKKNKLLSVTKQHTDDNNNNNNNKERERDNQTIIHCERDEKREKKNDEDEVFRESLSFDGDASSNSFCCFRAYTKR